MKKSIIILLLAVGALTAQVDLDAPGHVFRKVYFYSGKSTIKPESYLILNENAKLLKENPSIHVEIAGHTDDEGLSADNMRLSLARVAAVVDYLVTEHQIERQRLISRGYGETMPIASNSSESGRKLNNRVNFVILSGDWATTPTTPVAPSPKEPPQLSFSVNATDSDGDGIFEGGETVSLTIRATNKGKGAAQNVTVNLSGSQDLLKYIGSTKQISSINPDETKIVIFSGFLPYDVQPQNIEVKVTVSEATLGKIPQEKLLQVAIAPAPTEVEREVISKIVDVDQVPAKRTTRENTYAVIIGIEQYREDVIPVVDYARADAEIMREYLVNVAGVPPENVFTLYDEQATTTDMIYLIGDQLPMAVDAQSTVFIYYSGHGTHDDAGNAYLIPYNGKLASERFLYSLDDMNSALAGLPTENVVVMLDACFSGEGRSAVAAGDRPAVMTKLPASANAKHVTIAAAKADQPAQSYDDVKHGLFTYFVLKGLKGDADTDSDGWVELGELYEFVEENVSQTASRVLFKTQNPTVIPSDLSGKENLKIGKAR